MTKKEMDKKVKAMTERIMKSTDTLEIDYYIYSTPTDSSNPSDYKTWKECITNSAEANKDILLNNL